MTSLFLEESFIFGSLIHCATSHSDVARCATLHVAFPCKTKQRFTLCFVLRDNASASESHPALLLGQDNALLTIILTEAGKLSLL